MYDPKCSWKLLVCLSPTQVSGQWYDLRCLHTSQHLSVYGRPGGRPGKQRRLPIWQDTCSPTNPVWGQPDVLQSLYSPLYDISPYISHVSQSLCSQEMFSSPVAP